MQQHSDINESHSTIWRKATISALIILVLFALWTGIHETFGIWTVTADTVDMALLFHGLQNHGIQFLTTWRYTQDNWLLSLGPLSYVVYYLFGISNITLIAQGYFILVFNACLGGYILKRLLTDYVPSLFFLLACLLPSLGSMGGKGFMTFLLSHNSTMSIVLVSLLCLILIFMREKESFINIWLLLLSSCVFVGGISDPWFNAAFTLPAIVSMAALSLSAKYRTKIYISLLYIFIGLALSLTKLFGLLDFLPSTNYIFITSLAQLYQNVNFLSISLLGFINANELLRINYSLGFVYIVGMVYITIDSIYFLSKKNNLQTEAEKLFFYFSFLSIVIMITAYVFSDFEATNIPGRFLVNIFYLLWLIITYAYYNKCKGNYYKLIFPLLLLLLYSFSSIYQGDPFWDRIQLNQKTSGSISLLKFLEDHGLHYGYGGYWSSEANVISVMSGFHTLIRPVSYEPFYRKGNPEEFPFEYIVGNRAQSSPFWYNEDDIKKYTKFFLIIARGGDGTELYNNSIKDSENIALGQFGKPYKIYNFKNEKILVWNKIINTSIYGEHSERYDRVIRNLIYAYKCVLSKNNNENLYPLLAENCGCLNPSYRGFNKNKDNFKWTANGPSSSLGYQGKNKIGVRIYIDFENIAQTNKYLNDIFDKYGREAKIYFPYPKQIFKHQHIKNKKGFLMIMFDK